MKIEELKQIKQDMENGIVVSRATWMRVLEAAIEMHQHYVNEADFKAFTPTFGVPLGHTVKVIPPAGISVIGTDERGNFICEASK